MDFDRTWTAFALHAENAAFGMQRIAKAHNRLRDSRDFYKRRCDALQAAQGKMRDPERKAVCDILANGSTDALTPNK
ncbi:MAG: hypothetical protein KGL39_59285 [Patescibacteria group bacterium]|nr:hypothetical protein [Patescibacteria group bacterium]